MRAARSSIDMLFHALHELDVQADWQVHNVGAWYAVFAALLTAHLDAERVLLAPLLPAASTTAASDRRTAVAAAVATVDRRVQALVQHGDDKVTKREAALAALHAAFVTLDKASRTWEKGFLADWVALPDDARKATDVPYLKRAGAKQEWVLPWACSVLTRAEFSALVQSLPDYRPQYLRSRMMRYWWPQWRTRIEPLLLSIYDDSVTSPTDLPAPSLLWCCCAYDASAPSTARLDSGFAESTAFKHGAVVIASPRGVLHLPVRTSGATGSSSSAAGVSAGSGAGASAAAGPSNGSTSSDRGLSYEMTAEARNVLRASRASASTMSPAGGTLSSASSAAALVPASTALAPLALHAPTAGAAASTASAAAVKLDFGDAPAHP